MSDCKDGLRCYCGQIVAAPHQDCTMLAGKEQPWRRERRLKREREHRLKMSEENSDE